jgi:superfamily II DNA or RNA helicase
VAALHQHGNTLAVAPTGAGKTIMLSAILGELFKGDARKACVIAHRDELTVQNQSKFSRVNPHLSTGVYNATVKTWNGAVTFAMVQTLSRENNLDGMPALDALVVDEAHHARADSYLRVIDRARKANPSLKLLGMTATPNRGDKLGLRPIFSNVADQITVKELIASGHLVPPRTFVMNVGVQEDLKNVRKTALDYDMNAVASIMNTRPINDAVVQHWKEKAGDRKTVAFCSTVEHARDVCDSFNRAGIAAVMVYGDMSESDRQNALAAFTAGNAQVVVNVAVLTEGWDYPPTSCIILLRPSSYKSTMIQMIGRGLRTVDPDEFPDMVKKDCIVLDFGTSSLIHGTLEQDADLEDHHQDGVAPYKECPQCEASVPLAVKECPLCGHVWESEAGAPAASGDFMMTEIDLLKRSSFLWCDLNGDDRYYMATGFNAWAGVFLKDGDWHAVGSRKGEPPKLLASGERIVCFASADDWLNLYETEDTAHKTRGWLHQPATEKQLRYLPPNCRHDYSLTRYKASALMTMQFNRQAIHHAISRGRAA